MYLIAHKGQRPKVLNGDSKGGKTRLKVILGNTQDPLQRLCRGIWTSGINGLRPTI